MRTIIHDLNKNELAGIKFKNDDKIISALECNNNCIGCFSCWIKHPKKCIFRDDYSNIVELIKDSTDLIIISKNRYGCYSASTKRVLERCIGYVLPFFTIRNNEIHHEGRYDKKLKLSTYFYDVNSESDKQILKNLTQANAINLNASSYEINFFSDIKELKNVHVDKRKS